MNSHGRLTAWRHKEDLRTLRTLFFPSNSPPESLQISPEHHESITRAIAQVHLYSSRAKIPHTLQSTSHLFSVLLIMRDCLDGGDDDTSRLAASMALIRFVNGLLDPGQQSQYAIPLQVLAKKIGLPSVFVEFRHTATHEGMPSGEMCQRCLISAIGWLFENYWKEVESNIEVVDEAGEAQKLKELEKKERDDVVELWKQYRRIRRKDINKIIKYGDTSDVGKEYWSCVHALQKGLSHDNEWWKLSYEVMIERIGSSKLSFEQLKKLYEPLISHTIKNFEEEFVVSLCDTMLGMYYEYSKFKGMGVTIIKGCSNDSEWKHIKQWCQWLVIEQVPSFEELTKVKIIEVLGKRPDQFHLDLLKQLKLVKGINMDNHLTRIDNKIVSLQNLLSDSQVKRFSDADDILGDLEILKKRKLEKSKKTVIEVKIFERHSNWTPKPFGVL